MITIFSLIYCKSGSTNSVNLFVLNEETVLDSHLAIYFVAREVSLKQCF
jgi:hypothetical protein